jgi:hypothetical protein
MCNAPICALGEEGFHGSEIATPNGGLQALADARNTGSGVRQLSLSLEFMPLSSGQGLPITPFNQLAL